MKLLAAIYKNVHRELEIRENCSIILSKWNISVALAAKSGRTVTDV